MNRHWLHRILRPVRRMATAVERVRKRSGKRVREGAGEGVGPHPNGRRGGAVRPQAGGKGLGVQLFQSVEAIAGYLDDLPEAEAPIDGSWLIQVP